MDYAKGILNRFFKPKEKPIIVRIYDPAPEHKKSPVTKPSRKELQWGSKSGSLQKIPEVKEPESSEKDAVSETNAKMEVEGCQQLQAIPVPRPLFTYKLAEPPKVVQQEELKKVEQIKPVRSQPQVPAIAVPKQPPLFAPIKLQDTRPEPNKKEDARSLQKQMKTFIDLTHNTEQQLGSLQSLRTRFESLRVVCQSTVSQPSSEIIQPNRPEIAHSVSHSDQAQSNYERQVTTYLATKYPYQIEHPIITFKQFRKVTEEVWKASKSLDNTPVVTHAFISEMLTYRNFKTLLHKNWLNDEILNAYIRLINKKHGSANQTVLNTHFATTTSAKQGRELERVVTRLSLTPSMRLVVPVNYSNQHWFTVVASASEGIKVYDSMLKRDAVSYLNIIPACFLRFCKDFFGVGDLSVSLAEDFPQQVGGYDCGVYTLRAIKGVMRGEQFFEFDQQDIRYLRLSIAVELIRGELTQCKAG